MPSNALAAVDNAVMYTYIGGGVPNQPPNTYALVFKRMPLPVASALMATCLHHNGGVVEPEMHIFRQRGGDKGLTQARVADLIEAQCEAAESKLTL